MTDSIRDGTGTGNRLKIDSENRAATDSRSKSIQNVACQENELAFQLPISPTTLAAATVVGLHVTNNNTDKNLIFTYIRHQIIDAAGGTAFPNASNYFKIAKGRDYSSGGSAVTPINTFIDSGKTANVTAYTGAPTLTGTAIDIDRWYTKAEADMNVMNKEGALILPPNKSLEFSYVGDHTSGILYLRVSFILEDV